jgi:hypothetical protein
MRKLLLAMLTMACLMPPAAEAARPDTPTASRNAAAARANATRPAAPARPAAATAKASQPRMVEPRTAQARAAQPRTSQSQATPSRAAQPRMAALRHGDVRSQRDGVVVRGASAAVLPRGAARETTSARGAPREATTCTRRNGRTTCTPVERPMAWQAGLPRADNSQRECPAGTFATLARGHDDVVRCMPI